MGLRASSRARVTGAATAFALAFPLLSSAPAAGDETAPRPVDFRVRLDSRARLGGTAAITINLKVDHRRVLEPVTGIEILTPKGLDIASSGLGLETCRIPDASITNVLTGSALQVPCPANSLLGRGTAAAQLRFNAFDAPTLGQADISLFAGETQRNRPGLVIFVASFNPLSTGLAYTGSMFNARRPYGLGMKLLLPLIPSPPFGATVSLARMSMTIGARDITYTEQEGGSTVRYRPDGLTLPTKCPRGGLAFRVKLTFADAPSRTVGTRVACPRRKKAS